MAGKFLARLLAGGMAVALVGSVPLYLTAGRPGVLSWWLGAGVSLANCFWGTMLLAWSTGRSSNALLGAVCGGFLGRLLLAMLAFYFLRGVPGVREVILGLSIVGFYVVGTVLEIRFLQKHVFPAADPGRSRAAGEASR